MDSELPTNDDEEKDNYERLIIGYDTQITCLQIQLQK